MMTENIFQVMLQNRRNLHVILTKTSKDKLLKMSYDKDPQAFEARMRSLYPSMFSAKNRKPAANTRTTQREVSPGTNTTNESE